MSRKGGCFLKKLLRGCFAAVFWLAVWLLLARLAGEERFGLTQAEMEALLDPKLYTGRCAEQVERFLNKVKPLLDGTEKGTASIEL